MLPHTRDTNLPDYLHAVINKDLFDFSNDFSVLSPRLQYDNVRRIANAVYSGAIRGITGAKYFLTSTS